jgi:FixJ family two-component response regulator
MGPHQLVYIVDDNEAVLDSTGMLVKSAGIAVREFSSSLAFLRDFEAAPECCVILDINMPEMSGFRVIEFFARARNNGSHHSVQWAGGCGRGGTGKALGRGGAPDQARCAR